MEAEKLREYVAKNREWEEQLTKRNQQYIFDLNKALDAANLSEEEKVQVFHEMLPVLVQEQKNGTTARQLYGTVSERTEAILATPTKVETTRPVLMWVDNTLLILGVFGLMMGIVGLFSNQNNQVYGIVTLILMAMVGGWVFYLMYKYMYQYERPGADKSQRPKLWKSILILIASFFVWTAVISLSALLPGVINPVLDPFFLVLIGGASLLLRYYLKKRYNIIGSLSMPKQ
ncbi:DUF1129 domain-containing protein [Tetragenococcus koreensis]|uniref:Membrane protein n=1 Tax=Tetragenococcus koreensis TaxID=290335 RepID=A0AAN4ZTV1_9ENTE|nr:DUF1129 domain-containing protein [Tetragenococcus koreensis]AYW46360.1 DUF1129 domain-containing protein [Tetragenococcus koreensis]MCF1585427.1 DUF1129 domain-containing protein [Tetragenococcus koreensis]MCF1614973.1 DUF1129 domain-containing protein [Tetragenococcus koreensis]MCF1618208.1 DUF1129 domain-containing protein [Tetragenococcus koreensis]MCF1619327.1 DUF1129 domain-containing protein [Tetragenococcus koreensis]